MTNSSKLDDVRSTPKALNEEFAANNWAVRLEKCASERVDETKYEDGEKEYHTQILSRHYENDIHIAFTITYLYHGGGSLTKKKMLLINGQRHIVP
ncbi:MAG: hypothetical protein WB524_09035 [Acidobacteriaceae bacterium]